MNTGVQGTAEAKGKEEHQRGARHEADAAVGSEEPSSAPYPRSAGAEKRTDTDTSRLQHRLSYAVSESPNPPSISLI